MMAERCINDLKTAHPKEIGGVLFGEQLAEGNFRIAEMTRQRFGGGTATTFRRQSNSARKEIHTFHKTIGGNPRRFNYLGEWHSHPNGSVCPSLQDEITMRQLLVDQGKSVNFLVLMILKLDYRARLQVGASAYLSSGHCLNCNIEIEDSIIITTNSNENKRGGTKK